MNSNLWFISDVSTGKSNLRIWVNNAYKYRPRVNKSKTLN